MKRHASLLAAIPLILSGAAMAAGPAHPDGMAGSMPAVAAAAPVDREMMAGMATMQRDMSAAPMNGNPDHDFASMMIPHHQGAVAMAETELRDGRDPQMRALARRIVADQEREIAAMRAWLAAHPGAR